MFRTRTIIGLNAAEPTEIKLWPQGKGGEGAEKVSLFAHIPELVGDKSTGRDRSVFP